MQFARLRVFGFLAHPSSNAATRSAKPTILRQFTAIALIFPLVLMTSSAVLAQQMPYPAPQQNYSYNQYAPDQYTQGPQYPQPPAAYNQSGYAPQPGYNQGLGPDQLEQLVAPIALDPDPLVALILAASTFPQQVAQADQWRQSQGNASPDQIVYGADQQNWDPSVKALTAFPQVLGEMDQNIQWTAALGNAYYNQPQDILQAIQIMRQRAQSAGNLQSTPEETVDYNQGGIQLMPANPQVVYVPSYNPWTVYGDPVTPYPGFSLFGAIGSFFNSSFGSSAIRYGLGIVLSAFSHTPWGLLSWGLNWLTQNLLFHGSDYYSSSPYVADWGLRYGGQRARFAPHRVYASYGWNRGRGGYGSNSYNNHYRSANNNSYRNQYAFNHADYRSNYSDRSGYRTGIYNRAQSPFANHSSYNAYGHSFQNFNRSTSGSNMKYAYNDRYRSQSAFANRSGYSGARSYESARASHPSFNRSSYSQRSYGNDRGNAFSSSYKAPHSGGFHLFGSHNNSSFGHQSYKAPHYKAPKYRSPHGSGGSHHFSGGGGHHSSGHSGGHHH